MPPGGLHLLILGPGNDIYNAIEKHLNDEEKYLLDDFESFLGNKRANYHGKSWEGNQLGQIMKEKYLTKLEELLPERLHCFVEAYRMLGNLYSTVSRSEMKTDHERYKNLHEEEIIMEYLKECNETVENFMEVFDYLKFTYDMSKTSKIHTIEAHLISYIKMSGKPLGSQDQVIEATHQYFDQRMTSSKYKVKDKSSEVSGKKLLSLVLHFNSYNIYN